MKLLSITEEPNQVIVPDTKLSEFVAPNAFIRRLVAEARKYGSATQEDSEGCKVTAVIWDAKNPAAVAMGSIRSEKKAAASRANGKRGGRPRTRPPRVKTLPAKLRHLIPESCGNFSETGSVTGMRAKYYGQDALLVRCGGFIFNVSAYPEVYAKAH